MHADLGRLFFIGDIHGCGETFRKLLTEEIGIGKNDRVICIGDYIDRGPDSKGVVDLILDLRKKGFRIDTLRGNHEQMLLDSENSMEDFSLWLMNGGEDTLKSFEVESIDELEPVYIDFFRQTKFFILTDEFIAVHAGLNFNSDDPLGDKNAMLWIRGYDVDRSLLEGRLLIHGHTPMEGRIIRSQDFTNVINIDGGCVYKHYDGMGSLFAFDFYGRKFLEACNID